MKSTLSLIRDLLPLLAVHAVLLAATLLASITQIFPVKSELFDSIVGDAMLQVAWLVFLIPGWLLAPLWTPRRASLLRRYFGATVSSIAMHGVLASLGWVLGQSLESYFVALALVTVAAAWMRMQRLSLEGSPASPAATLPARKTPAMELVLIGSLICFCIAVFRTPRSNDIRQFVLQQQDMVAERTFEVSPIGMAALGVNEPMPRWKAHLWHLLPSVLSVATDVPVDQVLLRYGTIPLAMTTLLCLWFVVSELSGVRRHRWLVLVAILGPVLLWYRSYNAFNYSFRLTNNFWLDKDFCLFFLIPTVVFLACGWLRGNKRFGVVLLTLLPAILKFHPMNAVYLILLLPVMGIWCMPWKATGTAATQTATPWKRFIVLSAAAIALFFVVIWIGDAQSYHREIREIVTLDFEDHQSGRPLHYWTGLYGAIPNAGLELDTTRWSGEVFHLKPSIILGCGLLLAAHGCVALVAILLILQRCCDRRARCLWGLVLTVGILWGLIVGSRFLLTAMPHLSGGVERLHWFAYLPCLVGVSSTLASLIAVLFHPKNHRSIAWLGSLLSGTGIMISATLFATQHATPWNRIRGVNSLLDFDLPYNRERQEYLQTKRLHIGLTETKPSYLGDEDVVLFLETKGKDAYWWIKQGVFWSDSYAEAFALHERDESFLNDRRFFYAMVDRLPVEDLHPWIAEKGITLIVDRRDGADEYLRKLDADGSLPAKQVESGVWRVQTNERKNVDPWLDREKSLD